MLVLVGGDGQGVTRMLDLNDDNYVSIHYLERGELFDAPGASDMEQF